MTVTAGYDPRELSPKIIISDYDGATQYTYESATIATTPTQDFKLTDLRIKMDGNGDYGNATLIIADFDKSIFSLAFSHLSSGLFLKYTLP